MVLYLARQSDASYLIYYAARIYLLSFSSGVYV
jgi:hypothetical protein